MENLLDKHGVASAFAAVNTAPTFASDSSSQSTHTGELGLGRQSSVTSRLPQLLGAKLGSKVRPGWGSPCCQGYWAAAYIGRGWRSI